MGHGPRRCPEPKKEEEVSSWGAPAGGNGWEASASSGVQGAWDSSTADADAGADGWTHGNADVKEQTGWEGASAW